MSWRYASKLLSDYLLHWPVHFKTKQTQKQHVLHMVHALGRIGIIKAAYTHRVACIVMLKV